MIGGEPEPGEHSCERCCSPPHRRSFAPVDHPRGGPARSSSTRRARPATRRARCTPTASSSGTSRRFETVYEFYPRPNDVIWSPADWAWIAGIMDILVPAWFYGLPVVVDLDGVFTAERAVWLMREFGVTLTLLPATALRMIRAAGMGRADSPTARSARAARRSVRTYWAGVRSSSAATVNEGYGQTELNVCIGNCASVYPMKPGSLGRALPGTIVAMLDDDGNPVIDQVGEIAIDRHHPNTMLEYWRNPEAHQGEVPRRLAAHRRPRPPGRATATFGSCPARTT